MPALDTTKSLFGRAAVLAVAGAAIGLVGAAAKPGGLSLLAAPRAASCEAPAAAPTLISPTDAARICAVAGVFIADARTATDYAAGHIAGAVHLPCNAAGEVAGATLRHLENRALVLVYGTSTQEALDVATSIARRLPGGAGPKIYALDGGFVAWEKAGLACASGPCEDCAVAPLSR